MVENPVTISRNVSVIFHIHALSLERDKPTRFSGDHFQLLPSPGAAQQQANNGEQTVEKIVDLFACVQTHLFDICMTDEERLGPRSAGSFAN